MEKKYINAWQQIPVPYDSKTHKRHLQFIIS